MERYGFAYEGALVAALGLAEWRRGRGRSVAPQQFVLDSPEGVEALEYLRGLTVDDRSTPCAGADDQRGDHPPVSTGAPGDGLRRAWQGAGLCARTRICAGTWWSFRAGARRRTWPVALASLSRMAADPDAAWELLSFLSGPKGQGLFAESGLITPARRSVREDHIFLHRQPYNPRAFLDGTAYGRANLHAPRGDALNAALDRALLPVWRGEQGVAEALAGVRPEAERLLAP